MDFLGAETLQKRSRVINPKISFAVLEDLRVHLESPEQIVEMKFLLLEQKYLELLYKGNSIEALKVSFPFLSITYILLQKLVRILLHTYS